MNQEKLIASLVADATPVEPFDVFRQTGIVVLALIFYISVIVLAFGARPDWSEEIMNSAYALEMMITLILIFASAVMSVRLGIPRSGGLPIGWLLAVLALAMGAVIWLVGQVSLQTLQYSLQSDHFYITCGVTAGALPVAIGLFWMLRQASPTQLGWAGALALLSASATGHFLMRTIGQADNFADVLVWCYSPVLVLALLGSLLGQKLLRW